MKVVVAFLLAALCSASLMEAKATEIDASDPRIQLIGRWDRSKSSQPWCAWQGSAIRVRMRGGGVMRVEVETTQTDYVRVVVDGESTKSEKFKISPGRRSYALTQELVESVSHDIEIVKETYSGEGRLTLHGISVDGDLVDVAKLPKMRIEFFGDSNLAGQSLESEKDKHGIEYMGCHFTFAGIAARMLDADYQNISVSGATIGGQLNSVMSFYDRLDFYHAEPKFDFEEFHADVCVINIGANDIGRKRKQQIKADYKTLIAAIRKVRPNAHLVLMNAYGWDRNEPANYTDEIIREINDAKLSQLLFPWLFNEWHGCEYDHAGMAARLVEHIVSLNPKWKSVNRNDVMDGFGRRGNVANGGFEQVAPFGGYGWRYFEDGALRIEDPSKAAEGNFFVRLPAGAGLHQPVPTSKGKRHKMSFKARGDAGCRAMVQVEFRDQAYRNEIEDSAVEFSVTPKTEWSKFDFEFISPDDGDADRSRQPWKAMIHLKSIAGSVDFDDVVMSTD